MDEKFTVRRFVPADAADVLRIIHRGLREINGKDYPAKRIEEYCACFTTEKIIGQAETAHMYVAVSDSGRILGTGTIAPFWGSGTESILLTIYVLPEMIGQGIGTAIIQKCTDEARAPLWLYVFSSNSRAISFYRRNGFSVRQEVGKTRLILHRKG